MARPILVFDSGIGGLSVLSEIKKLLPEHSYCYLFDNARLPYGELPDHELISGCVELVSQLARRVDAAIVVIACNSASTLVLDKLRQVLTIPVVGVVPAIKPAAKLSQSKHIGLLATPGTIRREYTHELIAEFAQECKVRLLGSSELVHMAEDKLAGKPLDIAKLANILNPIRQLSLDVLVLGCTHFPLLKEELSRELGEDILLLDSGQAVASRVSSLLGDSIKADYEMKMLNQAYFTASNIDGELKETLAAYNFHSIERVNVGD